MDRLRNAIVLLRGQLWIIPLFLSALALGLAYWVLTWGASFFEVRAAGGFRRLPPCLIGMEACSTAHFWARELAALGHEVRLMPAAYVKPYVKRGKSDALDAEGICVAVTRPTMRYVAVKGQEQQAVLMLHRTRDLLVEPEIRRARDKWLRSDAA